MKVQDVMSKTLFCCTSADSIQKAAQLMKDNDVGAIPVVNDCDQRKLLGIITDRDICVKAVAPGKATGTMKVSEIMTKSPVTCGPNDSLESCEALMERNQVRRIPVLDARGACIGVIAQADIALHDTPEHISKTIAAVSQHRAHARGPVAARAS